MLRRTALLSALLFTVWPPGEARADWEVVKSTHGNLLVSGYAIGRYTFQFGDDDVADAPAWNTFSLRSASLILRGDIFEYAGYFIYLDPVLSPALVDAYGTLRIIPHTEVSAGQFLVPFSRESYTSTSKLLMIDRSLVSVNTAPPMGRDIGAQAELTFKSEARPSWGALTVAVVNGSGPNRLDENTAKDLAFRLAGNPMPWEVLAPLTLELYFYRGKPIVGPFITGDGFRAGAAVAFDHDRFTFQAEFLGREVTTRAGGGEIKTSSGGLYLQASYKQPWPWKWLQILEPAARLESYDPDGEAPDDEIGSITGGLNFHFDPGHHCKFMANYQFFSEEGEPIDNDRISAQLQVRF